MIGYVFLTILFLPGILNIIIAIYFLKLIDKESRHIKISIWEAILSSMFPIINFIGFIELFSDAKKVRIRVQQKKVKCKK